MAFRYGQSPLAAWHFAMPRPNGPMRRSERDEWLELIMGCAFHPPAGPKVEKRIVYGLARGDDEPETGQGRLCRSRPGG